MAQSQTNTIKNIKYLGNRPENDQENYCREELCNLVRGVGCFHELYPEKFYLVNLAKDEDAKVFCEKHSSNPKCSFIFWGFHDYPDLVYEGFNMDFGPFNLASTHQFISRIKVWLDTQAYRDPDRYIAVVLDDKDTKRKLNATLLVAIASMVLLNLTDDEVLQRLDFSMMYKNRLELYIRTRKRFNDVTGLQSLLTLTLEDCIRAFCAAIQLKFYDYYEFDHTAYQFYETITTGDLNWVVPGKLLAFAGPSDKPAYGIKSYNKHPPKYYYHYFKDHNVTTVIRLNDPEYNSKAFVDLGIDHHDLIFPDGQAPTVNIANRFVSIVEQAKGAVAVHCYAGIGRTGTLIAVYLIMKYGFTPQMAIAWIRICRPGSVVGEQQDWLYRHFDNYVGFNPLRPIKIRKTKTSTSPIESSRENVDSETNSNTTYSMAEKTYGQAKALLLAKSKREEEHYERPCTRSSYKLKIADKSSAPKGSEAKKNEPVLDLGKTVPLMLNLADFKDLKDNEVPKFYHLKDGKYEWKVKFPDSGYVELIPSMIDFRREIKYVTGRKIPLERVFEEPTLEIRYDTSELAESEDNALPHKSIPRLKPVMYFKMVV